MKLSHPVSIALAMIVTMVASAASVIAVRSLLTARTPDSVSSMFQSRADNEQAAEQPGTPAMLVARPTAPAVPQRPTDVRAEVLVADTTHDATNGRIALPSGTRLQLRLTPSRAGRLEVHAVNSVGERAALWSAAVAAGLPVHTPRLVLEGQRGLETLQVVLRSASGQAVAQREVRLWHE